MALAYWHAEMSLPLVSEFSGFHITENPDILVLSSLTRLETVDIEARLTDGHRPYVAWINNTPVAYGWSARQVAEIGELGLRFRIPRDTAYLWDFATLLEWRGLGIYTHLLQSILVKEQAETHAFWIVHAPENHASAQGITRAGFRTVGELSFLKQREGVGLTPQGCSITAHKGAHLLRVELEANSEALAPCWCCVLQAREDNAGPPGCWTAPCQCSRRGLSSRPTVS